VEGLPAMSADAELAKPPRALDSSLESQIRPFRVLLTILGAIAVVVVGRNVLFSPARAPAGAGVAAAAPQIVVVTATPTPTAEPTLTPFVVTREVERLVIVTQAPEVRVERVEVPVEVAGPVSIVPVTATPTPTPVMGPGSVRVCVWMAGVKEVYIAGVGAIPGGCRDIVAGVGSSYIMVQVNR